MILVFGPWPATCFGLSLFPDGWSVAFLGYLTERRLAAPIEKKGEKKWSEIVAGAGVGGGALFLATVWAATIFIFISPFRWR